MFTYRKKQQEQLHYVVYEFYIRGKQPKKKKKNPELDELWAFPPPNMKLKHLF